MASVKKEQRTQTIVSVLKVLLSMFNKDETVPDYWLALLEEESTRRLV